LLFKRLICVVIAALGVSATGMTASAMAGTLTGEGSSLVAPLENEWAAAFQSQTGNKVDYGDPGSGPGQTAIENNEVDFGASDYPLPTTELGACSGGCLVIPWALSATGIGYNIPHVGYGLHLSGSVIANIWLGSIRNWDSPEIAKLNKGVHLPNLAITPVVRTGGSGDSYAFSHFLADHAAAFRGSPYDYPSSTMTTPPDGVAKSGNAGVAGFVSATPGAIGYISGSYLIAQEITTAKVENAAGNYEYPEPNQIKEAAATVKSIGPDGVSIVDPPKKEKIAYPISTFTYALVPKNPTGGDGPLLKQWLTFCLTTGHSYGFSLDFVPLSKSIQDGALAQVNSIS